MLLNFAFKIYSHLSNNQKSITAYYNHVSALKTSIKHAGIDCSITQCTSIATAIKVEFITNLWACLSKQEQK